MKYLLHLIVVLIATSCAQKNSNFSDNNQSIPLSEDSTEFDSNIHLKSISCEMGKPWNFPDYESSKTTKFEKIKINFNDPFYLKFKKPRAFILNSNSKLDRINVNDPTIWRFPFFNTEIPTMGIPIFNYSIEDISIVLIAFGYGSSDTHDYSAVLFTFNHQGDLIEYKYAGEFHTSIGDNPQYRNSKFVKKYGHSGFSEIKVQNHEIYFNSSRLKLYENGTEEITHCFNTFKITSRGNIEKNACNCESFYFVRKGLLLNTNNIKIQQFS